jgi:4-amino-4-deoxy-L-arabinose transferase-like glycosyltransferase
MLLRVVLAYVAFPGQGFAADLNLFAGWAATLGRVGPGAFYQASGANYPPGYMYVLWLVDVLARPVGAVFGISSDEAILWLLKVPPMLADAAIAVLLYRAGRSWFGGSAGLLAAALYLFAPISWYDSALWGQVDAVGSLLMLAGLIALADGWSEPATSFAVASVLVKPQDAICLVVILPVLARRHLLRIGSGPRPRLGTRLAALDRRLHGLLTSQGPLRLVSALAVGAIVGIVLLLPFDIQTLASNDWRSIPVVGHIAGLASLFSSAAGQFDVLTANAFNAWSLVGQTPLTGVAGSGTGTWTLDSLPVLWGIPAVQLGAALLVIVGLTVAGGLLVRDDRLTILLAFAVVAFAFYAVPTRVHERYLFALFPAGALLVCNYAAGGVGYAVTAVLNAVNVHAVLGNSQLIGGFPGGGGGFGGRAGGGQGFGGGGGFNGGFGVGPAGPGGSSGASSISLPFVDLARSEPVVAAVAIGQTLAFIALLGVWIAFAFGPLLPRRATDESAKAADAFA